METDKLLDDLLRDTGAAKHPAYVYPAYSGHPLDLIAARLRLNNAALLPFQAIYAHEAKDDGRVYIFIVNNGKPLTLEDDYGLFPSDQLITQLRLIMDT